MSRRLLYADALRGFFILYIVWVHALNAVVYNNDTNAVNSVHPLVFLLLAPLAILATWAPIFPMISGSVNAYAMHNAMKDVRGQESDAALNRIFRGALTNNVILYLMSVLNMTLFHHSMEFNGAFRHTLLTGSLHYGAVHPYSAQLLFYNDALATVAVSGIVVSVALYFLWRNGGYAKTSRNFFVLTFLGLGWVFVSPFLHARLDAPFYAALDHRHWLTALGLKFITGPNQSPFPNVAYGLFGTIFGLAVSHGTSLRQIRRYGYGLGAGFLTLSALLIATQGLQVIELTYHTFPIKLHFMNLGLMLCLTTFLIDKMEYQSEARRAVVARRTTLLRRVGMVALTVFLLEGVVSILLSKLYIPLWSSTGVFPKSPVAVILFLALLLAFWNVVLYLWEKAGFRYGFEWLSVQIVGKVRGRRSARLSAAVVLYDPAATAAPAK